VAFKHLPYLSLKCAQKLPELKLNAVTSVQSLKIAVLDINI